MASMSSAGEELAREDSSRRVVAVGLEPSLLARSFLCCLVQGLRHREPPVRRAAFLPGRSLHFEAPVQQPIRYVVFRGVGGAL